MRVIDSEAHGSHQEALQEDKGFAAWVSQIGDS